VVVGSGPDGLAAAYYLSRLGHHDVTVLEALPEAGGMLRYRLPEGGAGLPEPRRSGPLVQALEHDLGIIESAGVTIRTGSPVYSPADLREQGYDAIFISASARAGYPIDVPGAEAGGVPEGEGVSAAGGVPEAGDGLAVGGLPAVAGSGDRIALVPGSLRTSVEGVFVGGDATLGPASAVQAIAHGRDAARAIDRHLGGSGDIDEHLAPAEIVSELPPLPVETGQRFRPEKRNREQRAAGAGVEMGYSREDAIEEASRCLRCDLREARY
jgi:NADPH-dependent glutamate synthase beta subunit-like oxidoreductase